MIERGALIGRDVERLTIPWEDERTVQ